MKDCRTTIMLVFQRPTLVSTILTLMNRPICCKRTGETRTFKRQTLKRSQTCATKKSIISRAAELALYYSCFWFFLARRSLTKVQMCPNSTRLLQLGRSPLSASSLPSALRLASNATTRLRQTGLTSSTQKIFRSMTAAMCSRWLWCAWSPPSCAAALV